MKKLIFLAVIFVSVVFMPVSVHAEEVVFPFSAEDGTTGLLYFEINENGTYDYIGYEADVYGPQNFDDYPEYNGGTGDYYAEPDDIPLGENEFLIVIPVDSELDEPIVTEGGEIVSRILGKKYFVVKFNGESVSVSYKGHLADADFAPLYTKSPLTGNADICVLLAAAALSAAVMYASKRKIP